MPLPKSPKPHQSPVMTKSFVRGFTSRCFQRGLTPELTATLLQRAHLRDKTRNDPHFYKGFVKGLQKRAFLNKLLGGETHERDPNATYTPVGDARTISSQFVSALPTREAVGGVRKRMPDNLKQYQSALRQSDRQIANLESQIRRLDPSKDAGTIAVLRRQLQDAQRGNQDILRGANTAFGQFDKDRDELSRQLQSAQKGLQHSAEAYSKLTAQRGALGGLIPYLAPRFVTPPANSTKSWRPWWTNFTFSKGQHSDDIERRMMQQQAEAKELRNVYESIKDI